MRQIIYAMTLALGLLATGCAMDRHNDYDSREISLSQMPQAVQATIKREAAGGPISELEVVTRDGSTSYSADVIVHGVMYEIEVAPDGKLLDKQIEEK